MKRIIKIFGLFILLIILYIFTNQRNIKSSSLIEAIPANDLDLQTMEQAYTYEEILEDMKNNELASEELINSFKESHKLNLEVDTIVLYSKIALEPYKFKKGLFKYNLQPEFVVGLEYSDESAYPIKMVSVASPYLYTGNGRKCVFKGDIFYKLEAGNSLYCSVSGLVYKDNVEENSLDILNIINRGSHIKDVSFEGRYYSAGMDE